MAPAPSKRLIWHSSSLPQSRDKFNGPFTKHSKVWPTFLHGKSNLSNLSESALELQFIAIYVLGIRNYCSWGMLFLFVQPSTFSHFFLFKNHKFGLWNSFFVMESAAYFKTRTESAQNLWLIQMSIHLYTRKRKKARTALHYKFIFFIIKYISNIKSSVGGLVDGKSVILAKSSGL